MRPRTIAFACASLLACDGSSRMGGGPEIDSGARVDTGPRGGDGGRGVDGGPASGPDTGPICTYPADAVEPMMRMRPLWPYRWPEAIDGIGNNFPIDLTEIQCLTDENIDWSPFDVLVFIAIPAW
jgi:hypothetical protein